MIKKKNNSIQVHIEYIARDIKEIKGSISKQNDKLTKTMMAVQTNQNAIRNHLEGHSRREKIWGAIIGGSSAIIAAAVSKFKILG